ncbi:uncharacterized protein LOC119664180, partial [Teleopsis dalmanni]|uniref:uncharacterized protein LOC119664180 n=1 Tax=Teleopsis dalmanni TaxID=139649 RepID=UPI0018CF004D
MRSVVHFFSIKGYVLYRHDRKNRKGGGVAIYCKSYLSSQLISTSDESDIEFICVSIGCHSNKILVSCVYNPHNRFSCDPLFDSLLSVVHKYDFIAVLGDFNYDFLVNCSKVLKLKDLLAMMGLSVINETEPTRYCNSVRPSLLDIFAVSDPNKVLLFDQISFISDHDLLFATLDFNPNRKSSPSSFSYRDFKSVDTIRLFDELNTVDWSDC